MGLGIHNISSLPRDINANSLVLINGNDDTRHVRTLRLALDSLGVYGSTLEGLVIEVPELDEQIGFSVLAAVPRREVDSWANLADQLAKKVDFTVLSFRISQLVEREEDQAAMAEDGLACCTRWCKLGIRNISSYGDPIFGIFGDLRGVDLLGHVLDGDSSRHDGG